jgi:hypothetical protein
VLRKQNVLNTILYLFMCWLNSPKSNFKVNMNLKIEKRREETGKTNTHKKKRY